MPSEHVAIYEDNAGGLWLHADSGDTVYKTTGEVGGALEEAQYVLENPNGDGGGLWDKELQYRWKYDFDPDGGKIEVIALYYRNASEIEIIMFAGAPRAGIAGRKYLGLAKPGWGGRREPVGGRPPQATWLARARSASALDLARLWNGQVVQDIRLEIQESGRVTVDVRDEGYQGDSYVFWPARQLRAAGYQYVRQVGAPHGDEVDEADDDALLGQEQREEEARREDIRAREPYRHHPRYDPTASQPEKLPRGPRRTRPKR